VLVFGVYLINFLFYVYFTFFINWKTGYQLKIHLVKLLKDENEYTDDSFVVVFKSENIKNNFLKLLQIQSTKIN